METLILTQSDHQVAAGTRLRRLIVALDLHFTEAADMMGVSKGVLGHWMEGRHPIGTYPLYRLCRSTGVDFDFVFLGNWDRLPAGIARKMGYVTAAGPQDGLERDHLGAGATARLSIRKGVHEKLS